MRFFCNFIFPCLLSILEFRLSLLPLHSGKLWWKAKCGGRRIKKIQNQGNLPGNSQHFTKTLTTFSFPRLGD